MERTCTTCEYTHHVNHTRVWTDNITIKCWESSNFQTAAALAPRTQALNNFSRAKLFPRRKNSEVPCSGNMFCRLPLIFVAYNWHFFPHFQILGCRLYQKVACTGTCSVHPFVMARNTVPLRWLQTTIILELRSTETRVYYSNGKINGGSACVFWSQKCDYCSLGTQ